MHSRPHRSPASGRNWVHASISISSVTTTTSSLISASSHSKASSLRNPKSWIFHHLRCSIAIAAAANESCSRRRLRRAPPFPVTRALLVVQGTRRRSKRSAHSAGLRALVAPGISLYITPTGFAFRKCYLFLACHCVVELTSFEYCKDFVGDLKNPNVFVGGSRSCSCGTV